MGAQSRVFLHRPIGLRPISCHAAGVNKLTYLAAGAVDQVRSRTVDLLPVVVAVAEIMRDIDLADRQSDLMLRLELGLPFDLLGIARVCRGRLTRAEYLRLHAVGLGTVDAVAKASVEDLAKHLRGNKARASTVMELVRTISQAASQAA